MGLTEIYVKSPKSDIFHTISYGKACQINGFLNEPDALRSRSTDGKTPLIYAVCEAKEEVRTHLVRVFLRHGSDVNSQDHTGRSALMYACMDHEKLDLVRVIARHKRCDPNIQDCDGYTAIMHAVLCANASAIRVLINSSSTKGLVDIERRNSHDLSALDLAVKFQLSECCKVLIVEGGANSKLCRNQVGLMRLLESENFLARSNTPHSRTAFANNFRKFGESPIPENKQFEGTYMSRDTTPVYGDRFDALGFGSQRSSPQQMSRSNSLYRTNSNLFRKSDGSRPLSLPIHTKTPQNSVLGFIQEQQALKRALTPISRTSPRLQPRLQHSPESIPDELSRARLPSIPSGKKLYLVTQKNYDFSPLNSWVLPAFRNIRSSTFILHCLLDSIDSVRRSFTET